MLLALAILLVPSVALASGHGATQAVSSPAEVCVDDDYTGATVGTTLNGSACGMGTVTFGTDAFATVTDGVNAVAAGGTIHVANGIYQEAVHITKSVNLVGQSLYAVIQAPNSVPVCTTTSYDWHAIVCVTGSVNVTIDTLTIDGLGKGGGNVRFIGVGFRDANGALQNSTILNIKETPFSGAQHGVGLVVYEGDGASHTFTVANNVFRDFQKNAMALYTDAAGTTLTATIDGNHIYGRKGTNKIAQNGVQVYAAAGTLNAEIKNNVIDGIAYDNTADTTKWVATSILNIFANANIHDNVITGTHMGIYAWDGSSTIANNDLTIEKIGVSATGIVVDDPPTVKPSPYTDAGTGHSPESALAPATFTATCNGNTVKFSGTDNTNTYGLTVYGGYGADVLAFTGSHNTITGFDYGAGFYQCDPAVGSCGTAVPSQAEMHHNVIQGNNHGAESTFTSVTVDLTKNWWGSATGPYHATDNPNGLGNDVTGALVFEPWCTDAYCTPYIPSLGDFNGDGVKEMTVFRASDGTWHIRGQGAFTYGMQGDVPVPGDYNGDGKDDIAVFRPSNGTWYIHGQGAFAYGQKGDIPVPADYNGDGKTDLAVFRPSDGKWHIQGLGAFTYGQDGDIPVPADYNGDGKAEFAVFRPSNGTWYIRGIGAFPYGAAGDIPVPAHYQSSHDSIAVFRPSNGTWYLRGMGAVVFGTDGDVPSAPQVVPGMMP